MIELIAFIRAYWKVGGVLLATLAVFLSGVQVERWRNDAQRESELQKAVEARIKAEEAAAAKSKELEESLAVIQKSNRELNRRLAHEVQMPGYSCPVPANGLQLLREAVTGTDDSGKPDRTVP